MNSEIAVFIAGFLSVFLLGFQSRLVNTGNFLYAGLCSFTIAIAQTQLWSKLMAETHSWTSSLVYGLSGFTAITAAMYVHRRIFERNKKE